MYTEKTVDRWKAGTPVVNFQMLSNLVKAIMVETRDDMY